jgi:putative sugar O-methyltransferase
MTHPSAYPAFCRRAARDAAAFAAFKREPAYAKVVEHLTCDEGARYLERLLEQSPELEPTLPLLRANDRLGSPLTCDYEAAGTFSPTTLRYAKVLSDLLTLFGTLDGMHVVEIGGGYGGQCLVLSLVAKPASYTLIDLDPVLDLQETYLRRAGVRGARFVSPDRVHKHGTYDLVISNYAFSECARPTQEQYMEWVLQRSTRGYVTYNWWAPEWAGVPYDRDELLAAVPGSRFVDPVPQLIPTEELWLWGDS